MWAGGLGLGLPMGRHGSPDVWLGWDTHGMQVTAKNGGHVQNKSKHGLSEPSLGWVEHPRTGVDRGSGGRPNPDPRRALQFLSNFLSDEADVAKLNDAFRICIGIVYKPANGCIGVEYGACAAQAPPPHQNRL